MLRNALGHVRRTARPVAQPIKKWKIVRGDLVEVTTGKFKGQQGTVLKCLRDRNQVVVEGVNVQSRLIKNSGEDKATLKTWESPLHYSNVSVVDPSLKVPAKVAMIFDEEGDKQRVSRRKPYTIIPRPEILKERRAPKPIGETCDTASDVVLQNTVDESSPHSVLQDHLARR